MHGVQSVHSEMVSDIKSMGGIVFGLPADYFMHSCDRFKETRCRELLLSPMGKYTKFPPFLFPRPNDMNPSDFLKTAVLVHVHITVYFFNAYRNSTSQQALRAAFFGKSSVGGGGNAPGPQCKAKLWDLRDASAGMVAGAAIAVSTNTL